MKRYHVDALVSRSEDPQVEYVLYEDHLRALEEQRQARLAKVSSQLAFDCAQYAEMRDRNMPLGYHARRLLELWDALNALE